jgi:hypothetical protein
VHVRGSSLGPPAVECLALGVRSFKQGESIHLVRAGFFPVQVTREIPRNGHGYVYLVTFIDVRLPTEEGLLMDGEHYEKAFVLDDPYQTVRRRRSN